MYNNLLLGKTIAIVLAVYLIFPFISVFAKAYVESSYGGKDVYDLWSVDSPEDHSFSLYYYLKDRGLIVEGLSFEDFDYISVLTQQLCSMTKSVTPDLALAMIAYESNFDVDCKTGRARGLMQLIPIYHSARMENFVEDSHQLDLDDFFNPRLNIATGLDYMDYLLEETKGDIPYALMWYNQGPTSASKEYLDKLHVSSYAKKVIELSKEIKTFLREEGLACS